MKPLLTEMEQQSLSGAGAWAVLGWQMHFWGVTSFSNNPKAILLFKVSFTQWFPFRLCFLAPSGAH